MSLQVRKIIQNKFDAAYVLGSGSWLLVGHLTAMLGTLGTSYVFANYVDPQLYGNYRYLVAAAVFISLFSWSGLLHSVVQAIAKGEHSYFSYAARIHLKSGLLSASVALLLSCYYVFNDNILLAGGLLLIGLIQPLISTTNLVFAHYSGKARFDSLTKWQAVRTFCTSASVIIATLTTANILIIFAVYLISQLLINVIPFFRHFERKIITPVESHKKYTSYAKHLSVQNIFIGGAAQLDKILVFQLLGAVQLAAYIFVSAIPDQFKGFTKIIDTLLLTRFSTYDSATVRAGLYKKCVAYLILSVGVVATYFFIAPYIFTLLFPVYKDYVWLSQLYALTFIFSFISVPLTAMKANLENKSLYNYHITSSVIQVVLTIVLLPKFGLLGAVVSQITHKLVSSVLILFLYKRTTK